MNEKYELDVLMEYVDESNLDSVSEDEKYLSRSMFDRLMNCNCI